MSFHAIGQTEWMTMQLMTPQGQQLVENTEQLTAAQAGAIKTDHMMDTVKKYALPVVGAGVVAYLLLK